MIVCGGAVLAGGLTWRALETGTISNHADNFVGDVFFGAGKFSLWSGRDLRVLDVRLVHEILSDGNGAVFKIVVLGEEPRIPRGRLFDADVHDERVLDLFCVIEDTGGSTSD